MLWGLGHAAKRVSTERAVGFGAGAFRQLYKHMIARHAIFRSQVA